MTQLEPDKQTNHVSAKRLQNLTEVYTSLDMVTGSLIVSHQSRAQLINLA